MFNLFCNNKAAYNQKQNHNWFGYSESFHSLRDEHPKNTQLSFYSNEMPLNQDSIESGLSKSDNN